MADVRYPPKVAKVGPNPHLKWRMMVTHMAGDTAYYTVEDIVDWHGLGVNQRRRKTPELVRNLITVYASTTEALVSWRDDFMQGHTLSNDIDKQQDLNDPEENDQDGQTDVTGGACCA